jgi:hypothetical protein
MDILQQREKRLQDVRSQHTSFLIEDILFRPKTTLPQVGYVIVKERVSSARVVIERVADYMLGYLVYNYFDVSLQCVTWRHF